MAAHVQAKPSLVIILLLKALFIWMVTSVATQRTQLKKQSGQAFCKLSVLGSLERSQQMSSGNQSFWKSWRERRLALLKVKLSS